jgi:WD40 repeat protein
MIQHVTIILTLIFVTASSGLNLTAAQQAVTQKERNQLFALQITQATTRQLNASASTSLTGSGSATTSSSSLEDETKREGTKKQNARERAKNQLEKLLYDLLDPMPQELIDLILGYNYEFKGSVLKATEPSRGGAAPGIVAIAAISNKRIAVGYDMRVCMRPAVVIWELTDDAQNEPSLKELNTIIVHDRPLDLFVVLKDGRIAIGAGNTLQISPSDQSQSIPDDQFLFVDENASIPDEQDFDLKRASCLTEGEDQLNCLTELPHNRLVSGARCSYDRSGANLKIWNTLSGKLDKVLEHYGDPACSLVTLDNDTFASGSDRGKIRIWRSIDGAFLCEIHAHSSFLRCLAILGNGDLISASSNKLKRWDLRKKTCVCTIRGKSKFINIAILPDNNCVVSDSKGNLSITKMNAAKDTVDKTWKEQFSLSGNSAKPALAVLPNGRLVLGDYTETITILE